MLEVELYSDGSSRGNPGKGGYGTILKFVDAKGNLHVREFSRGYKSTTNNRMELMSCIVGFEALKKPCHVKVFSDSKYLVDAFNKDWVGTWLKENFRIGKKNEVKNIDLWKRLLESIKEHEVEFIWVKGHAGHIENERCDQLAVLAALSDELYDDIY